MHYASDHGFSIAGQLPTATEPANWIIMCHRSSLSAFGAASAVLKRDGVMQTFTEADAKAEAARLNAKAVSGNVSYVAEARR